MNLLAEHLPNIRALRVVSREGTIAVVFANMHSIMKECYAEACLRKRNRIPGANDLRVKAAQAFALCEIIETIIDERAGG